MTAVSPADVTRHLEGQSKTLGNTVLIRIMYLVCSLSLCFDKGYPDSHPWASQLSLRVPQPLAHVIEGLEISNGIRCHNCWTRFDLHESRPTHICKK